MTTLNKIFLILALVIIALFIFQPWKKKSFTVVRFGENEISVEVADTPAKRSKGLMFRKDLAENSGMLFVFDSSDYHTFWMANTYIPLDMIWISEKFEIVDIKENVPPCTETGKLQSLCKSYRPNEKAKYVLEVNAGVASDLDLKIGGLAVFE